MVLMPLLRQVAIRSLQTAIFPDDLVSLNLFSISVSLVSDRVFQSLRLYDAIRCYGDIFLRHLHSGKPSPGLMVTLKNMGERTKS